MIYTKDSSFNKIVINLMSFSLKVLPHNPKMKIFNKDFVFTFYSKKQNK